MELSRFTSQQVEEHVAHWDRLIRSSDPQCAAREQAQFATRLASEIRDEAHILTREARIALAP
jgi:hypothetical protein